MATKPNRRHRAPCPQGYLTLAEAARQIGRTTGAVAMQIRKGRLPALKAYGLGYCIKKADWQTFLVARQKPRQPKVKFPAGYSPLTQAAKQYKISRSLVAYLVRRKEIKGIQRQGIWGVQLASLAGWIRDQKQAPRIPPGYLSPQQASQEFGLRASVIRNFVTRGRVVAKRSRGKYLAIERKSLEAYLQLRKNPNWYLPRLPDGILSVSGAAKLAQVAPRSIRNWVFKKGLPAERAPKGRLLIQEADLRAFLERRADAPLIFPQGGAPRLRAVFLPEGFLSLTQAAKRAGVKRSRVQSWIDSKLLPAKPWKHGRVIVAAADLTTFLEERARRPQSFNLVQASHQAGVTEPALRRWIDKGALTATRQENGHYCILQKDLQSFLEQRSQTLLPTQYNSEFLNASSVAKRLGVDSATVGYWIEHGDLPAKKMPNGYWCIRRSDFLQFHARREKIRAPGSALLSLKEASQKYNLSHSALQWYIAQGKLAAVRVGRRYWYVSEKKLKAFLEELAARKNPPEGYLTLRQACEEFQLNLSTVHSLLHHGTLQSIRIGHRHAVSRESLLAYLASRRGTGANATASSRQPYLPAARARPPKTSRGMLTLVQAARFAGVKESAVKYWVRKKGLPAETKARTGLCIRKKALVDFLAKRTEATPLVAIAGDLIHGTPSKVQVGLTVDEAARLAGVPTPVLAGWARSGELRAYQGIKGQLRIFESDLREYLDEQRSDRRRSILVVDADAKLRRQICVGLQARKHEVESAGSVNGAKTVLQRWSPQFALINLATPSSWGLVEWLRTNHPDRPVGVLLMSTGMDPDADLTRSMDYQVQRLLPRPVSAERAILELERVMATVVATPPSER